MELLHLPHHSFYAFHCAFTELSSNVNIYSKTGQLSVHEVKTVICHSDSILYIKNITM